MEPILKADSSSPANSTMGPLAKSSKSGLLAPGTVSLARLPRALAVFATWGLLLLSQPGLFNRDGFGWAAFFALIPWALAASRPGPWARRIEWAGATFGLCGFAYWMRYLLPGAVFPMGAVPAIYMVIAGGLLRRLNRTWPLALAVPMAWLAGESVRFFLDAPLSFGWWRLGTLSHADFWYSEGARVFGVWGLSFGMAAFAGWVADRLRSGATLRGSFLSYGVGLGAPLAVILAGTLVAPPAMEKGPRVLVVTPGLEQSLKSEAEDEWLVRVVDPYQMISDCIEMARAAGEPMPDLVAFGETMTMGLSVEPPVWAALQAGSNAPEFAGRQWQTGQVQSLADRLQFTIDLLMGDARPNDAFVQAYEQDWLPKAMAGQPPMPPGTSLFAGVVGMVERDGKIWRKNAAQIWGPDGKGGALASKVHLVPAAENPYPAAYLPWLLSIIHKVGGYIPDFVTDGHSSVLPFGTRDGREYRVGVLICYDNSYDDPFTGVHGGPGTDFHLVASNEAWYEESVLMDHMLAFSRLAAIYSGRAVLRATNSGSSALVGPDGRILQLLQEGGRHKMVRGTLMVDVPVPKGAQAGGDRELTPYIETRRAQVGAFWLLLLGLLLGPHFSSRVGNRAPRNG